MTDPRYIDPCTGCRQPAGSAQPTFTGLAHFHGTAFSRSHGLDCLSVPKTPITDREYAELLVTIENEAETAFTLHALYEELDRLALRDSGILAALNADARFWTGYRSSIQANLFMTLSRLFDKTSGTTTIQRLLTITKTNLDLFSLDSLRARKMDRSGEKPGWLGDFMPSVWIPTGPGDFRHLQATLTPLVKTFHDVYIPIRDSVYAHRLMSDAKAGIDLFPKTSSNELGEIVVFSEDLVHCLRNLFDNGHKPILGQFDVTNARKEVRKTLESVLRKVVAQNR